MSNEESRRKAWERAFANTKLEFPDWQPDEEYMELVEKCIEGEITVNEIVEILVKKYKVR